MSCIHLKELEATYSKYVERRVLTSRPTVERRASCGTHRFGQARMAFIIRKHLQTCIECRKAVAHD